MAEVVRMRRGVALVAGGVLLGWAGSAPANALERKGTIEVRGTVDILTGVPADAIITAEASAVAAGTTKTQQISASVTLKRSGNKAAATLSLPYTWALPNGAVTVTVSFRVNADSQARPSSFTSVEIPLPADGATTTVAIPASI